MLTKNTLLIYQKLYQKKFRQKYELFLIEGLKTIQDFINEDWEVDAILYTNEDKFRKLKFTKTINSYLVSEKVIKTISSLKTPSKILAVVKMRSNSKTIQYPIIALDNIQDPGNFGTIIRTADWYGIKNIFCSKNTADCYNPKVVQASMGSLARIAIYYVDLEDFLTDKMVYAAVLNGKNLREINPTNNKFVLLLGNEGNGINQNLLSKITTENVTIPSFGGAESLNVSIATAICLERLIIPPTK